MSSDRKLPLFLICCVPLSTGQRLDEVRSSERETSRGVSEYVGGMALDEPLSHQGGGDSIHYCKVLNWSGPGIVRVLPQTLLGGHNINTSCFNHWLVLLCF